MASSEPSPHTPSFILCGPEFAGGVPYFKAYLYTESERPGGPLLFWELRGAVAPLRPAKKELHRFIIRNAYGGARSLFEKLGLWPIDYRPSFKAFTEQCALSEELAADRHRWRFIRREAHCSTEAFITMMLRMACSLQGGRDVVARNVLTGWFSKLCTGYARQHTVRREHWLPPPSIPSLCMLGTGGHACVHAEGLLERADARPDAHGVFRLLCDVYDIARSQHCEYSYMWMRMLLKTVTGVVDAAHSSENWPTTVNGIQTLRGQVKRRRLDVGVQEALDLCRADKRQKLSHARPNGVDVETSSCRETEEARAFYYEANTRRTMQPVTQLSSCFDASDLGCGSTLFHLAYSSRLGRGAWLIPKATGLGT